MSEMKKKKGKKNEQKEAVVVRLYDHYQGIDAQPVSAKGDKFRTHPVDALVDSFFDDPVLRYTFPSEQGYVKAFTVFAWWGYWGTATYHKLHHVAELQASNSDKAPEPRNSPRVAACSFWEMPGYPGLREVLALLVIFPLMIWHAGLASFFKAAKLYAKMETHRAKNAPEAMHLLIIGTRRSFQGQGIGSKVMREGLAKVDALGLPAYLESTNPKNTPFYQKHGFEIVEEVYPFENKKKGVKGPVMTLMKRKARAK